MIVFVSLVMALIGQFCCDVIGRQDLKYVGISMVDCCFIIGTFELSIVHSSLSVSFVSLVVLVLQ